MTNLTVGATLNTNDSIRLGLSYTTIILKSQHILVAPYGVVFYE